MQLLLLFLMLTSNPAVARVNVAIGNITYHGSGTLITSDIVITNWHVVRDKGDITVEFGKFTTKARVIKIDKTWDLAALRLETKPKIKPIKIGKVPRIGDKLTIAGYGSGNYQQSTGKLIKFCAPGRTEPDDILELKATARNGDSGGPILNQKGELVGVLFGSINGLTNGSHSGRILKFLKGYNVPKKPKIILYR